MKLITGTGLAAGALLIAGGTPVAALSQSASPQSPLGASLATSAVAGTTHQSSDADDADATTDGPQVTSDAADDVDVTNPEDTSEADETTEGSDTGSALGLAHAAAMKIWAQCVADAASGPKTDGQPMPPKTACGEKPLGPGQIKHLGSTPTVSDTDAELSTKPAGDSDTGESTAADDEPTDDIGSDHASGSGHHGASHHAAGHRGHHH